LAQAILAQAVVDQGVRWAEAHPNINAGTSARRPSRFATLRMSAMPVQNHAMKMLLCGAAFVVAAEAAARREPENDFMDRYISDSGASAAGRANVWWSDADARDHRESGRSSWPRRGSAAATRDGERAAWSSAALGFSASAPGSDSDIASSTREGGSSGAPRAKPRAHGAVVDIKLDSELQEATKASAARAPVMLQGGETHRSRLLATPARDASARGLRSKLRSRSAPGVEDAVARERMEDVYIHDTFATAAADDTKKEKEVNANKDMKP